MELLWIQITILITAGFFLYREILKSVSKHAPLSQSKAGFGTLTLISILVVLFTYIGMSITLVQTKDLRPFILPNADHGEWISPFDHGVIEVNGMTIKTNLAPKGSLKSFASTIVESCHGNDGCEAQKLFDYVTNIRYQTDYTSRQALDVIESKWGDCDDKSNLFASLLNERGISYVFIYVPHHVFVAVHVKDTSLIPFLHASIDISGKQYYYAETTATGAKIGEFNGQFPTAYDGIYDIQNDINIPLETVAFRVF